ncbi:branched-chain amino acid ABC transporter permease [Virgisporangium aliadipatigenens]|uniref:Branched-chain amino acid ABC transporter permease n=1 Tax=Virgisporangium aliadipatigenens TaxID=741659 RepID=A0A8J3YNY3_9ACTN|nr:branched-chain amino acid ABC transporter permease [Virgisporangium aliadipatigenens]GIJ49069.1 branched-chain amino acid ABC transporter permease [Virgisporangium aliadipatigenens]
MDQLTTYAVTSLDGVAFGLLLFTVGAGLALIFGVMDIMNLAHGTLYLVGAYVAATLSGGGLLALGVALAVGLAVGAGGGAALSFVLRPLGREGSHLDEALVTLGIAFIAADGMTAAFGAAPMQTHVPTALEGSISLGIHAYPVYRLVFIGVAALVAVLLHVAVRRSTPGKMLRATISDPDMAAASGIDTGRVRTAALAVGGALAVGAGVLGAPLLGPGPGVDNTVLVLSLIVVVVGGAGSIPGTLLAALLVGQVQTIGVVTAPALAPFALFGAMLIVLVLRGRTTAVVAGRPA